MQVLYKLGCYDGTDLCFLLQFTLFKHTVLFNIKVRLKAAISFSVSFFICSPSIAIVPCPASCYCFILWLLTLSWKGFPHKKHLWSHSQLLCKSRHCTHRVLGTAILLWLVWLPPQGVMIDCKPHWHPEKTTACICACVHVCVLYSLEHYTHIIFTIESWLNTPCHTLEGIRHVQTQFLAPLSSMLGISCTQRAH